MVGIKISKKGQLTVAIILGLGILIVVAFLIYVVSTATTKRAEATTRAQELVVQLSSSLEEFVTSCLKLTALDGIVLLGMQGGLITPQNYVSYAGYNTSFGILPMSKNVFAFKKAPPEYPYSPFPKPPIFPSAPTYGYYGDISIVTEKRLSAELSSYIESNIQSCTDWSSFAQKGIDVKVGKPSADVLFGDSDTTVSLRWRIEAKSGQAEAVINKFAASIPVRMKVVRNYALEIASNDTLYYDYEPSSAPAVQVFKRVDGKSDIIQITDTLSKVDTKPFIFRFARKNRPPVLFDSDIKLRFNEIFACPGDVISFDGKTFKITKQNGDIRFSFAPNATDFDEDSSLSFNVSDRGGEPFPLSTTQQMANIGKRELRIEVSDGLEKDWYDASLTLKTKC
ncbi:MAG: hypothetical protein QXU88_00580 [Candidatus Woesearchaeota archaeon]